MPVLEISELGCYLCTERGFIVLKQQGKTIHRQAIDQVSSIITKAHGITYSQNLLVKLAKHHIPVVITNQSFMPVSIITPLSTHGEHSKIIAHQARLASNIKNKLWQAVVKAKIKHQAEVLKQLELDYTPLTTLIDKVNSGDKLNIEAQAARKYWLTLFGDNFKRGRFEKPPNNLLNYGYIVFRSSIARYLCASGLSPALGIKHHNKYNSFCLVDDLIEVFRPIVDIFVYKQFSIGNLELDSENKRIITSLLLKPLKYKKWLSVENCMKKTCQSLSRIVLDNQGSLALPKADYSKILLEDEIDTIGLQANVDDGHV